MPVSRPANKVFEEVAVKARSTGGYLERMERLHSGGNLSRRDLLRVYGGAFLTFQSVVENSIESLFIGLASGRLNHPDRNVRSLVEIRSPAVARRVVYGARPYADWLPYNRHTIPRAEAFLSGARPFCDLPKADRTSLDNMATLRNALAHKSSHALKQFRRIFTDGKPLPPEQCQPPGYLRGQHAAGQTRVDYLMSSALQTMRQLCGA